MLAISAIFEVNREHVGDFGQLALRHAANSLTEDGCKVFDVFVGQDAPTRFYFHECYADQAAVEAHGKMPYFAEFISRSAPWVVSKEIAVWSPFK